METKPKPFSISKRAVWEAWLRVKANLGAAQGYRIKPSFGAGFGRNTPYRGF